MYFYPFVMNRLRGFNWRSRQKCPRPHMPLAQIVSSSRRRKLMRILWALHDLPHTVAQVTIPLTLVVEVKGFLVPFRRSRPSPTSLIQRAPVHWVSDSSALSPITSSTPSDISYLLTLTLNWWEVDLIKSIKYHTTGGLRVILSTLPAHLRPWDLEWSYELIFQYLLVPFEDRRQEMQIYSNEHDSIFADWTNWFMNEKCHNK
jgi:hypothetical protein